MKRILVVFILIFLSLLIGIAWQKSQDYEAPRPYGRGIFSLLLRRERNPSEAETSSHSGRNFDLSAKRDKISLLSPVNAHISPSPTNIPTLTPTLTPTPTIVYKNKVLIEDVPFSPQAPFAEWSDPRQQDACEEAAVLLAIYWAKDKTLTKTEAKEEILKMASFQQEEYEENRDTALKDTAQRLIKEYFQYNKYQVQENITVEDIKNELIKGNLIIVPTNGQALKNPHFKQPGPERHNVVIRGFNDLTKEFITNDPGIKEGELYRYPQQVLFDAIRDYPTGYHLSILETKKIMIVISR